MAEDKHDRFQRGATKRMGNILHDLDLLKNLSNRSTYEYTESDTQVMFDALDRAMAEVKASFKRAPDNRRAAFSFTAPAHPEP